MNKQRRYLALNFGAGRGTAVAGAFNGDTIALDFLHRFPVMSTSMLDTIYWDFPNLIINAKLGLSAFVKKFGVGLDGVGCCSWGVDFGLLDKDGRLLANPMHYMDPHTDGVMERLNASIPARSLYQKTGSQPRRQATLYQLYAMALANSPLLDKAVVMLLMADLVSYFLSGNPVQEYTLATTTAMYDAVSRDWSRDIMITGKIPPVMVPEIVAPGTVIDSLTDRVAAECGMGTVPVIAPASHCMACAVTSVPAKGDGWMYIVSGHWNHVGIETSDPIINDDTYAAGFTNEGGVDGSYRLLKSIGGMNLLSACAESWASESGEEVALDDLLEAAARVRPLTRIINPDDPRFFESPDAPDAINRFLREHGQPPAEKREEFARLCLDSLALAQRHAYCRLVDITGKKYSVAHMVGWGARHAIVAQVTADALGIPVKAGPVAAKTLGNIIMQAIALGDIASLAEAREIVANSFDIAAYEPTGVEKWESAYEQFKKML